MKLWRLEYEGVGPFCSHKTLGVAPQLGPLDSSGSLQADQNYQDLICRIDSRMLGLGIWSDVWLKSWPYSVIKQKWDSNTLNGKFACSSKEQLMEWFGQELNELFGFGFRIIEFEVPDEQVVVVAEHQVLYIE